MLNYVFHYDHACSVRVNSRTWICVASHFILQPHHSFTRAVSFQDGERFARAFLGCASLRVDVGVVSVSVCSLIVSHFCLCLVYLPERVIEPIIRKTILRIMNSQRIRIN